MTILADDINVTVKTKYIAEQSVEGEQYLFTYTVTIKNLTDESVRLISRAWLITDADGETTSVEGEGVVGEKPQLAPQQSFTYTSGCVLKTPVGNMQGFYFFTLENGTKIKAAIPIFTLATPNILH